MKSDGLSLAASVFLFFFGFTHATVLSGLERIPGPATGQSETLNDLTNVTDHRSENNIVLFDSASLDSFIQDYMVSAHIPGLATWCFKNGQIIWQQNYGYADLIDSIEVTDTTMFNLGSIPKTFTGTAIMQLWERGVFELDDDINDSLPFSVHNPYYPDSAITFLMLMTHMSSIYDNEPVLMPLWHYGPPTDSPTLGQFMYDYLDTSGAYYSTANFLTGPPGFVYSYSSVGAAMLGYLVEVLEDSFPIHVQDSIFTPLGMRHSAYYLPGVDTTNFATGYHWNGSIYVPQLRWSSPWYPAGGVYASAEDLGRYLTAIYQYGILDTARILDSTTVVEILTPRYEYTPGIWIGLIWFNTYMFDRLIWGINGRDVGFDGFMAFCPDENSAVIALANCDSSFCTWAIGGALFDYAEQYAVEEHGSLESNTNELRVFPNPFCDHTIITYTINDLECMTRNPTLMIYDTGGRLVKSFDRESNIMNGESKVSWDGTDQANRKLSSGVYFLKLLTRDYRAAKKLLLIR